MAPAPPLQRLADVLLGDDGPVSRFIQERRARGVAWRLIARDLYEATDHEVDVTTVTLRSWAPDQPSGTERRAAS